MKAAKDTKLDDATLGVMRRMLNTPPKHHEDMKVGRMKKRRTIKGRAASAKPRTASKTDRGS